MSELGYFEPIPGIYGTPNPATDPTPESRAALQEHYAALQRERTTVSGYIPPSYVRQGGGQLPRIGWTAQGPPTESVFAPYFVETLKFSVLLWNDEVPLGVPFIPGSLSSIIHVSNYGTIGRTPDWDLDPNPISAGSYDMNQVFNDGQPVNPLNRAPVGELDYLPIDEPDLNFLPQDQGGTIDLEW